MLLRAEGRPLDGRSWAAFAVAAFAAAATFAAAAAFSAAAFSAAAAFVGAFVAFAAAFTALVAVDALAALASSSATTFDAAALPLLAGDSMGLPPPGESGLPSGWRGLIAGCTTGLVAGLVAGFAAGGLPSVAMVVAGREAAVARVARTAASVGSTWAP